MKQKHNSVTTVMYHKTNSDELQTYSIFVSSYETAALSWVFAWVKIVNTVHNFICFIVFNFH
jgi:hypothetical protein